jgi:hypothetical protein
MLTAASDATTVAAASTCTMVLLVSTFPSFSAPPPLTRDGGYLPRAACRVPWQPTAGASASVASRQSRNGELAGHSGLLCSRTRSRQALRLCDRKLSAVGSHGLAARHVPGNAQIQEVPIQWAAAVPRAKDHRRCRGMICLLLEKAPFRVPFAHALVVRLCMWKQLSLCFRAEASEDCSPVCHPHLVTLSITRPHCVRSL